MSCLFLLLLQWQGVLNPSILKSFHCNSSSVISTRMGPLYFQVRFSHFHFIHFFFVFTEMFFVLPGYYSDMSIPLETSRTPESAVIAILVQFGRKKRKKFYFPLPHKPVNGLTYIWNAHIYTRILTYKFIQHAFVCWNLIIMKILFKMKYPITWRKMPAHKYAFTLAYPVRGIRIYTHIHLSKSG